MATLARQRRISTIETHANAVAQGNSLQLEDVQSGENERNHFPKSHELRRIVRDRLLETIKSAIGREIVPRSLKPIDPRMDDMLYPNFYKWSFSSEYPCFPENAVGRWSYAAHKACLDALDHGWVSVIPLPFGAPGDLSHEIVDANNGSTDERCLSSNKACSIRMTTQLHDIGERIRYLREQIDAGDGLFSLRESYFKINDLVVNEKEAHQRVGDLLDEHQESLSGFQQNIIERAISKISLLEQAAKEQSSQYQQMKTLYKKLKNEFAHVSAEVLELKKRLENREFYLARERRQGELEDLRTVIQDLREERDAQLQRHLIHVSKVRDDAIKDGFRKGEASIISKSSSDIIIADLKRQLEENQANHAIDISKAREEGRREDEVLNQLLEGHNLEYKGRKRREIRTIYSNWKNIPQNILPKWMLPDGIILGDKTLILLARLSRFEHDPRKATTLLDKQVDLRNARYSAARKESTITNSDIEKALANLGDEGTSRHNSEISSAISASEGEVEKRSHGASESNMHVARHTDSDILGAAKNDSPAILEIPSSGQVTGESVTNDCNSCPSPEYVSQAEGGRWHVNSTKDFPVSDRGGSNPEQQLPRVLTSPINIKRPYEEEDIYGVGPSPSSQRASNTYLSTRTPSNVFLNFAAVKKHKIGPRFEDESP